MSNSIGEAADRNGSAAEAAALLKAARRILIGAHQGPDGDAVGSLAALGHICRSLGAEVRLFCPTKLPKALAWLPQPGQLHLSFQELGDWRPDLLALVDCANAARAGREAEAFFSGQRPKGWENTRTLCIDHHFNNPGFAEVNYINPTAGATCELIARLAAQLGIPLRGDLGEAVYMGLVADTGNFTYSSTSPSTLRLAAEIMENGLKPEQFAAKNDYNWSFGRMRLWGELLHKLKLHAGGRVVSAVVSLELLAGHGCDYSDLEGFVSFLRHLQGVEASLLLRERAGGGCKISLRSMGGASSVDVEAIAGRFGGGGHKSAAGAEIPFPPDQAERLVIDALREVMG